MLKLKLDKANYDLLPPALQSEYKADGDIYVLDTDVPFEDTKGLKSALAAEKEHRKTATEKVTVLETSIADLTSERDKLKARAGQPSDLEKSWEEKLTKATNEAKQRHDALQGQIRTLLVDNVASSIAGEISISPELLIPHIQKRLAVEESDGKHVTRVLDLEGKASAMSVNELKAEILANKNYAPIIKASQASGGGAAGGKLPPGGKAFKDMNEGEKTALFKSNPAEFNRQSELAKKSVTA